MKKGRSISLCETPISSVPITEDTEVTEEGIESEALLFLQLLAPDLRVPGLLFKFRSWDNQSLARQQLRCVHYVIKAFGTEATIESFVPHFQLCP
jgi:hypothetical protein